VFEVGGSQSSVATPSMVVTGAGMTGVVLATVPTEAVEPEEPVAVVFEAFVLVGVAAAVIGAGEVVFEATEATLAEPSVCERSIKPTFCCTRAVDVSSAVFAAAAALLLPSDPPPQAASGRVTRAHRRTLRAARVNWFM
jgi:hypothetical protein